MTLESLSNGGSITLDQAWLDEATQDFTGGLEKQLKREVREFRLRASNIGRPLCQLQLEAVGTPKEVTDYNHILRMMIGDATEAVVTLIIKASGANITGQKGRAEYRVGDTDTVIVGENDIEIDGKVYDIKSASGYSFNNKWQAGWDGLFEYDTFGYVEQLYIYAGGDPNKMGGWIVFDKSSGEIKVVLATPTTEQLEQIKKRIEKAEKAIREGTPFKKLYQAEEETFYRKPTGNKVIPMTCTFCNYIHTCWPDAVYMANPTSTAKMPAKKWYAEKPKETTDD